MPAGIEAKAWSGETPVPEPGRRNPGDDADSVIMILPNGFLTGAMPMWAGILPATYRIHNKRNLAVACFSRGTMRQGMSGLIILR